MSNEHALSEVVPFAIHSADDWRAIWLHHVNVLLEGPETALEAVVCRLSPNLRQPVLSIRSGTALSLPTMKIGTLILRHVHTLTTQDQMQLLEWLNAASFRPQVISTSPQPVFPSVELGLFAAALYYRLNVIRIQVDCSNVERSEEPALRNPADQSKMAFPVS